MKMLSWLCSVGVVGVWMMGWQVWGCSPVSNNTDASSVHDQHVTEGITSTIPDGLNITTQQSTKGQTFKVSYEALTSNKKIPLNELFDLRIKVEDANGMPAKSAGMMINSCMPDHNHCMFVTPVVEKTGDGLFTVKGLKFHMQGHWEIYVDVTDGKMGEKTCGRTCSCTSGDCALFNVWMEF